MASPAAKKFSLLLLFTLLSCPQSQARDSQSFSKVSAAASVPNQEPVPLNGNQQEEEKPNFSDPENENGYGLYGREAVKRPTSTGEDQPHRQLPRNYNPVAYVTEPEENTRDENSRYVRENTYSNSLRNYYNDDAGKSYDNEEEDEETSEPEQYRNNNDDQYYGGSSFNSGPQGLKNTRLSGRYGEESGFRPQGMSDTRSLENGKYFYDIENDRYSNNHPYEVLKRAGVNNVYRERSYYGVSEDSTRKPYQQQYQFQNEGTMP